MKEYINLREKDPQGQKTSCLKALLLKITTAEAEVILNTRLVDAAWSKVLKGRKKRENDMDVQK